ncbi:MAG: hypothetical protein PS018_19210 [bacterium]|nr:hypothetical protein [bacterium]
MIPSDNNAKPATNQSATTLTPIATKAASAPASSNQDAGYNPLVLIFGVGVAVWPANKVMRCITRRNRREALAARYGDEDADKIMAGKVWQGMSQEQLVESWGNPVDMGREVRRSEIEETWKYGQTGKNRFANRVYLGNSVVIGWKV